MGWLHLLSKVVPRRDRRDGCFPGAQQALDSVPPSLVAQLVKSPPVMQETRVRSLGWDDPLEMGKATHSSILVWRIPWTV